MSTPRLLAIVTDPLEGQEPVDQIRDQADGDGLELRLVAPAVEAGPFRHLLGDVDGPMREAEARLRTSLTELRRFGLQATGSVGDPDPVQAARDALREAPADQVLIFERDGKARWFEDELFERAREQLEPPLRLVMLEVGEGGGDDHVIGVAEAGPGVVDEAADGVEISDNLPRFHRRDLAGMLIGVVGTIVAAVLAAAAASDGGSAGGAGAAAILIAIGIALINLAHVVGLTLAQSTHYRSGLGRVFGTLSLIGTPLAVLANLILLLA